MHTCYVPGCCLVCEPKAKHCPGSWLHSTGYAVLLWRVTTHRLAMGLVENVLETGDDGRGQVGVFCGLLHDGRLGYPTHGAQSQIRLWPPQCRQRKGSRTGEATYSSNGSRARTASSSSTLPIPSARNSLGPWRATDTDGKLASAKTEKKTKQDERSPAPRPFFLLRTQLIAMAHLCERVQDLRGQHPRNPLEHRRHPRSAMEASHQCPTHGGRQRRVCN
jgi:hypothetical protein